jgi:hypothetical protein
LRLQLSAGLWDVDPQRVRPSSTSGAGMPSPAHEMPPRKVALIAGVLFVLTFVTSIPALLLYHPVLHDHGYITGGGADTQVLLGAFLELILIVANIGTAVVLFPILKRQSETMALGFVAARIIESAFIAVGILCVVAIVTLRQDLAGTATDPATLNTVARSLVAIKDWTFRLGPGFVVGIGNGMLLGYLMYASGLVPRRMAMLGLVGGPLIVLSGIAVLLGAIDAGSIVQGIATIPEFAWELSLGIYMIVRGFKSCPIVPDATRENGAGAAALIPAVAAR